MKNRSIQSRSRLTVSVAIKLKGLPADWDAWRSPSGNIFYYNGLTGLYTWEPPPMKAEDRRFREK